MYALYHAAGILTLDDIKSLRKFSSYLEGHLVPKLEFIDVATGSLGQGLSIALGMALGAKLKNINNSRYFALIGDSETAEGQFWEAIQLGSFYKLNNLIGIIDVNRLGQRGETMIGWDIKTYEKRISSFGWKTFIIKDGHDINEIYEVYTNALNYTKTKDARPSMFIAKTIKGKDVSFLENKNNWHGKTLSKEEMESALKELGNIDLNIKGTIIEPFVNKINELNYDK